VPGIEIAADEPDRAVYMAELRAADPEQQLTGIAANERPPRQARTRMVAADRGAGRERIREARDECRCPYVQPGVVPGADDVGVARSVTKAFSANGPCLLSTVNSLSLRSLGSVHPLRDRGLIVNRDSVPPGSFERRA
jgi:hypothetical protein